MRTARKRPKYSRQRGTHTHGWGSKKKHRGAGNRGGKGNANSGKRGDAMKPYFRVKLGRELGRHGFKNAAMKIKFTPVNIYYIENSFNTLKAKGYIKDVKGVYVMDLGKLGFNKLLSTGIPSRKYDITVDYASANAIEKIAKAGGNVTVKYSAEDAAESADDPEKPDADSDDDSEN